MASFKNFSSTFLHYARNLSWPLSLSRTHAFFIFLLFLSLFFFFYASLADHSPAVAAATLASRFLFTSTYISSLSSSYYSSPPPAPPPAPPHPPTATNTSSSPPPNTHLVSNSSQGNGTTLSAVTAVEITHRNSRKKGADVIADLSSCDIFDGNWVVDDKNPVFKPGSCPYIDDAFDCFKNGRPDSDFLRLRWKPHGCQIPRFNGRKMLRMLRGKRLVFVGDSLNRNMWESLVCSLRGSVKNKSRVFEVSGRHEFRTQGFYSFRFIDYKCAIDFIKSPFLVKEWKASDYTRIHRETLRLDMIEDTSSKYQNADIIVFNTGHWWTHPKTFKGKNYFQEGDHVYNSLEVTEAFSKALKTWAQWIDSNIDANRTRVFFRGYSASHFSGGQWNSGGNCDGETKPITNDTQLAPYPWMMNILESVMSEMKTPVFYLNITKMTDYRKDAHPSVFYKPEDQRSSQMYQDCSHWCLPGVPDSWNELLYATLLISHRYRPKY